MKRLVPTIFPFIKLWDWDKNNKPVEKSKDEKPVTKVVLKTSNLLTWKA